ncbi:hypothetical protein B484DRAFT_392021, partial [Ochromonadaceae sp. CCMP2298]
MERSMDSDTVRNVRPRLAGPCGPAVGALPVQDALSALTALESDLSIEQCSLLCGKALALFQQRCLHTEACTEAALMQFHAQAALVERHLSSILAHLSCWAAHCDAFEGLSEGRRGRWAHYSLPERWLYYATHLLDRLLRWGRSYEGKICSYMFPFHSTGGINGGIEDGRTRDGGVEGPGGAMRIGDERGAMGGIMGGVKGRIKGGIRDPRGNRQASDPLQQVCWLMALGERWDAGEAAAAGVGGAAASGSGSGAASGSGSGSGAASGSGSGSGAAGAITTSAAAANSTATSSTPTADATTATPRFRLDLRAFASLEHTWLGFPSPTQGTGGCGEGAGGVGQGAME